jgi:hypothetical protein
MPAPRLTSELIAVAVEGYESQKARIDRKIAELRAMLPGGPAKAAATPEGARGKRKKLSAAVRRKMAQSQKLRWAKIRGDSEPSGPATPEPSKAKGRISEEGMKRIIAATKKRWALKRAEAAKAQRTAKKAALKKAPVKKAAKKSAPVKKAAAKTAPAAAPAMAASAQ